MMSVSVDVGSSSRQGHRSSNQDRAAACPPWAFILDGVGGSRDGRAAAQVALGAVLQESALLPMILPNPAAVRDAIDHLVEHAHAAVVRMLGQDAGFPAGSTTLSMMYVRGVNSTLAEVTIASVGDSPVWVVSAGSEPVLISATPGRVRKNALDTAIGWQAHLPCVSSVTARLPSRLLLASDGVIALPEKERVRLLADFSLSAQDCASRLTRAAMHGDRCDNTTALVLDFGTVSGPLATDHLAEPL